MRSDGVPWRSRERMFFEGLSIPAPDPPVFLAITRVGLQGKRPAMIAEIRLGAGKNPAHSLNGLFLPLIYGNRQNSWYFYSMKTMTWLILVVIGFLVFVFVSADRAFDDPGGDGGSSGLVAAVATEAEFERVVVRNLRPVLVKFWADW